MLIIPVKEGEPIEKPVKKYKRKLDKTKILKQVKNKRQFIKPSEKKRQSKNKAIYKQKMAQQED